MVAKERLIPASLGLEVLSPYNLFETLRLERPYEDLIESLGSFITESYVKKGFIASERGKYVFGDYRLGLLKSGEAEKMTEEWVKEPEVIRRSAHRGTDGRYGLGNVFEAAANIYPKVFDQKLFSKWGKILGRTGELKIFGRLGKENLRPSDVFSTELGQYLAGLMVLNLFRKQGLRSYSYHVQLLRWKGCFPKNEVEKDLKGLVKRSVPYEFVARHLNEALIERESRLFEDDVPKIQCWRILMLTNLDFKIKGKWLEQILSGNIDQVILQINEMAESGSEKITPDWVSDSLKVIESKQVIGPETTYKSPERSLSRDSPQDTLVIF